MQKISDALRGCLEILLFLKEGPGRFQSTKEAFLLSFIVVLFLLPTDSYIAAINPEFRAYSFTDMLARFTFEYLSFLTLYLTAMYLVAKALNQKEGFLRFANAQNWLNIPQLVIQLPIFLGVICGRWTWGEVYYFLIFQIMYGYAYTAFLIAGAYRINWMLATGLSILGMAIGQFCHFLTYSVVFPVN